MKNWIIDYSVRKTDGEIVEETMQVEAENITIALGHGLSRMDALKNMELVEDAVIWNIGIIAELDEPEAVF